MPRTKIILSVCLLIVFSLWTKAQDLEGGFRLEAAGVHYNSTDQSEEFVFPYLPACIQLTLGIYAVEKLSFEMRAGYLLPLDDFSGFEYGLFSKYYFVKRLYVTAGIGIHQNSGGGTHNLGGKYSPTITMPSLGLGVQPWKHTSIELLYEKADNSPISYSDSPNSMEASVIKKVSWIVKLGFVFTWNSL